MSFMDGKPILTVVECSMNDLVMPARIRFLLFGLELLQGLLHALYFVPRGGRSTGSVRRLRTERTLWSAARYFASSGATNCGDPVMASSKTIRMAICLLLSRS